jgi:predicted pyridoxine 5'-phosphate oxidase superfamily flavin-nucleotide-binding protein
MFEAERARRPWHRGEAAAQRLAAVEAPPPVIRPFMTEQLRQFFPQLSLLLLAAVDADGFPSATFVRGAPGFIACPDPTRMEIAAALFEGDPLAAVLRRDSEVGLLGVDFRTRRRNRVGGRVESREAGRITITVTEAFGNCPKYIIQRETVDALASDAPRRWEPLDGVDDAAKDAVANAETFFVASSASCDWGGVDISHRGGARGFLEITGDGAIMVPDFRGNGYFNTLGNLLVQPRAGLLFPNFETGEALRLTGVVDILWEDKEISSRAGAERLWKFKPCRGWRSRR